PLFYQRLTRGLSVFIKIQTSALFLVLGEGCGMSLIEICGVNINIQGRFIRIACLDAEKYYFLDDLPPVLVGLKKSGIPVDLFTLCKNCLRPHQNIIIQWSGTIWPYCLSPPSSNGGRNRSVSKPETRPNKLRRRG